jgi:hypothetical protein
VRTCSRSWSYYVDRTHNVGDVRGRTRPIVSVRGIMGIRFLDGDAYLATYPRFQRWVHRCVACGAQGYKPEMPSDDSPVSRAKTYAGTFGRSC